MARDPRPTHVQIELTRTEALALLKVAQTGLSVVEALGLIQNTDAVQTALDKLHGALP